MAQTVIPDGIQKQAVFLPELEEPKLIRFIQSPAAVPALQCNVITVRKGVVDQRKQTVILGREVAVKALSGNIQLLAQIRQGDLSIGTLSHGFQKSGFQLALPPGRFFCMTNFVHAIPPFLQIVKGTVSDYEYTTGAGN